MQMAQNQQVLPSDSLWCEGMAEWVPAQSFSQLAAVFASVQAAQPTGNPGGYAPAVRTAGRGAVARKGPAVRKSPNLARGGARPGQGRPASRGPVSVGKKGGNFAVLGWALAGFFLGVAMTIAGGVMMGAPSLEEVAREDFVAPEPSTAMTALTLGGMALYSVSLLVYGIVTLVYLHRAWKVLQVLPGVRSTPGKAVGFLFIPLFNIYWLFVCYYGWAQDYNILKQRSAVPGAPDVPSGLFLAFCIITLVLGPFLHPFVMASVCKGLNFLASTPDEDLALDGYA